MRAHKARALVIRHSSSLRSDDETNAQDSKEETQKEPPIPPIGPAHQVDAEHEDDLVDLLNPRPAVTIDFKRIRRALSFGFAGGDMTGTLVNAHHRAPVAATSWEPHSFAEGLFVPELLRNCMKIHIEGFEPQVDLVYLIRLLTHPPQELAVVEFRRGILQELAEDTTLRSRFQEIYRNIYRLRGFFESEVQLFELDSSQRRLETLAAIRDTVESMANGFASCRSGLRRFHAFAMKTKKSEGYHRLTELLDYDNHLAAVELKLRLGADGRIRRFEILKMTENRENRFYQSPLGRFFTRIILLFRGYFLGEGELINRWVDSVFEGVVSLLPPLIQLIAEMEFYLSGLAFKDLAESKGLAVCFPELEEYETSTPVESSITGLFNPLLFGQEITPVACDIHERSWELITIVTGPNSGGKTRLLQGLALAQMLSQCGMYAPAHQAKLVRAPGLFVSLIQEAKADQREGRLGTELIRIRQLFERAKPGYLIVLDELCSGTNPSEGEEIFRLVISLLRELRPCVFITTHFLQFAARLREEDEDVGHLDFLQVQLDDLECPTFRFIPGVAQTSLAHQTAARLGVTREELLALVRRNRG